MGGRYVFDPESFGELKKILNQYVEEFGLDFIDSIQLNEIRPGDTTIVLIDQMKPTFMKWGYTRNDLNKRVINARSESLTTSSFFNTLGRKRCVVPATGYYEWDSFKQKTLFSRKSPIYFAAIYNKDNEYAILTQEATEPYCKIHDRMPVILTYSQAIDYLNHIPVQPQNDCEIKVVSLQLQLEGFL